MSLAWARDMLVSSEGHTCEGQASRDPHTVIPLLSSGWMKRRWSDGKPGKRGIDGMGWETEAGNGTGQVWAVILVLISRGTEMREIFVAAQQGTEAGGATGTDCEWGA